MKTRTWGRLAPMLVVPALMIGLAGCSDDDKKSEDDAKPAASDTPSDTPTTPEGVTPEDIVKEPVVNKAKGAIADIDWDQSSCPVTPGDATVEGTLTNPTKERTGYALVLNWTDDKSNVLGRGVAVIRGARPGEETPWTIEATVPEGVSQCVLSANRGVIPK